METLGSALPQPKWLNVSQVGLSPSPLNLVATAASLHLGHRVSHHLRLELLLHCCYKKLSRLGHVPRLKDVWCEKALQFKGFNFLQFPKDTMASTYLACFSFFNGGGTRKNFGNDGAPRSKITRRNSFNGRRWTNVLLAVNVLVFIAQTATQGKLLFWGAKINSFIDKGQLWRLATSSFLHANIGHLMVNCYSLNSIGPSAENISGPRRFLAVYFASAIASSATSYWFCKQPAVGASGAIFGLDFKTKRMISMRHEVGCLYYLDLLLSPIHTLFSPRYLLSNGAVDLSIHFFTL
ncbi:RHOMBOID-like protein 10, chloroplastic isoform X2 [Corylus avellana]|uniref:RHOMBOID-like protein 10, chloroplastic isoform X2 n=1 Tax=Corylus avellana TaxID=13451 RepID=UPI00286D46FC|nr:RHOMBOID-like protein 10, chloroplastic isoform X2 [Corylus avellana]